MENAPEDDLDVHGLIEAQRKLIESKHPFQQVVGVLWINGSLKRRLAGLSDRQVGQLVWDHVLDELTVFGPEEAICEHAVQRLVRSGGGPWREQDNSLTDPATPPCPVCGSETTYRIGIDEPDFLLCVDDACGHKELLGVSEPDESPEEDRLKRAALYCRVSTVDQHPETQLHGLREFAGQRGLQVVNEYTDHGISGNKARRPALDQMLEDARRRRFDVLLVWSCDRLARSTRHFLQVLDELDSAGVEFVSQRECFDTTGPLGRAFLAISAVLAEMERSLLIERVKSGMRRAKLDGKRIGREPMRVDREQVVSDRRRMSLSQVAKKHGISRASVCRLIKQSALAPATIACGEQQLSAGAE